ncbi:hypothetical protein BJX68DRAFT_226204 [Aspergillus pseudodeflectus]|uniref:Uncharacterized protein n=1 Tax=Aspergillus pseudodeflectus TaxID=176178 RepID=A0ABR4L4E6_9EURO
MVCTRRCEPTMSQEQAGGLRAAAFSLAWRLEIVEACISDGSLSPSHRLPYPAAPSRPFCASQSLSILGASPIPTRTA